MNEMVYAALLCFTFLSSCFSLCSLASRSAFSSISASFCSLLFLMLVPPLPSLRWFCVPCYSQPRYFDSVHNYLRCFLGLVFHGFHTATLNDECVKTCLQPLFCFIHCQISTVCLKYIRIVWGIGFEILIPFPHHKMITYLLIECDIDPFSIWCGCNLIWFTYVQCGYVKLYASIFL